MLNSYKLDYELVYKHILATKPDPDAHAYSDETDRWN